MIRDRDLVTHQRLLQVVDAARRLFLADGFAGTSMDAVVAEAGVSKQTLYRYFPSKLDLLAEVVTSELDAAGLFPEPGPLHSIADLRAQLLGVARGLIDELMRPERVGLLRLVFGEAFRIPELRDVIRTALPAQLLGRVEDLLVFADQAGLVRVERPDLIARLYLGSAFSFIALDGFLRADPLPPPSTADLEVIVDAFLKTVGVR